MCHVSWPCQRVAHTLKGQVTQKGRDATLISLKTSLVNPEGCPRENGTTQGPIPNPQVWFWVEGCSCFWWGGELWRAGWSILWLPAPSSAHCPQFMITVLFFARGKLKSRCISQQNCDPEYLDEGSCYLPFEGLTPPWDLNPSLLPTYDNLRKSALMEFYLLV